MSSIKQIGYPVPTLCRKMTISPVSTRIVPVRSFGDRLLIYFWLTALLVYFDLVLLLKVKTSIAKIFLLVCSLCAAFVYLWYLVFY